MEPLYPIEIRKVKSTGHIEIDWSDDSTTSATPHLLRQQCKCAHCLTYKLQTHQLPDIPGTIMVTHIVPVGDYALNFTFSDGHDRGIYPWEYLRELGE